MAEPEKCSWRKWTVCLPPSEGRTTSPPGLCWDLSLILHYSKQAHLLACNSPPHPQTVCKWPGKKERERWGRGLLARAHFRRGRWATHSPPKPSSNAFLACIINQGSPCQTSRPPALETVLGKQLSAGLISCSQSPGCTGRPLRARPRITYGFKEIPREPDKYPQHISGNKTGQKGANALQDRGRKGSF